jgi:hypothetical protein
VNPDVFGPIVTGRTIRMAVKNTVRLFFPDYIAEVADHAGLERGVLPTFRAYLSALDMDNLGAEGQIPACVTVAAGIMGEPTKRNRHYHARWAVAVGAVVIGQDRENTMEHAELYAAALRTLIIQHPSLGGVAEGVDWLGERYNELPNVDLRTLAAGSVQFAVDMVDVVDSSAGIDAPTADPTEHPDDFASVDTVNVQIQGRE